MLLAWRVPKNGVSGKVVYCLQVIEMVVFFNVLSLSILD
jgi:hypothetical protein